MKFTCEKNALVSAISVASRTVAQKSTIPALEGIYIRAGVKLTLSGYNLETGITISVDADIQETGACIMPSRLFFDIIRKLPDDTVSISVDENFKVSIRGGISSFSITAMSSEDYPELPEVDSEKGIDLPQSELKAMIGGTSFAVSENQARPIHTGCLFEVADDSITVVASTATGSRFAAGKRKHPSDGHSNSSSPPRRSRKRKRSSAIPTRPAPSSLAASISSLRSAKRRLSAGCSRVNSSTGGACFRRTSRSSWRSTWQR